MRSVKLEHELLWVSKCWLYKTTCTARVIKSKLTAKERKQDTCAHVNCSTYITLILFWIPKLASIPFGDVITFQISTQTRAYRYNIQTIMCLSTYIVYTFNCIHCTNEKGIKTIVTQKAKYRHFSKHSFPMV